MSFPFRSAAVGITAGLVVAAAAAGFVLLPMLQGDAGLQGVWDAICTAAGVIRPEPAGSVVPATMRTSRVVVTPQMMGAASAQSIGQGATISLQCASCHGVQGLSQANVPNLAGQYAAAVYKELQDYKSGARTNSVMTPLSAGLTEQDMRDLAAYYAYLPRLPASQPSSAAPVIVESGAPMRNIAACGACHGGPEVKAGSAWLDGQPAAYLQIQLRAFASGDRHNDINGQMRNVARGMTDAEIDAATRYYASRR
jgi:cytochrome c553